MIKLRTLALLLVAAHWAVAITHLFLAAKVLAAPDDHVSSLALVLITLGHIVVSLALWKLSGPLAGLTSLIFFLSALGADLYEHFLHASGNNVFMVASGHWSTSFAVSVLVLLALEMMGCSIGAWLLGSTNRKKTPACGPGAAPRERGLRLSARLT